jgi:folate-dependent phosphoribosylglycinamide formyltransferase PurN
VTGIYNPLGKFLDMVKNRKILNIHQNLSGKITGTKRITHSSIEAPKFRTAATIWFSGHEI